jgi:hypothetical protein
MFIYILVKWIRIFSVVMLLGFVFFLVCLIAGKPGRLYAPRGSDGMFNVVIHILSVFRCGYEYKGVDLKDKKYSVGSTCVDKCPGGLLLNVYLLYNF